MDLIYTNSSRVDQGVLLDYDLDLAFGSDENNLECRVQAGSHCCESGSLLYMEGTEYGGIVDSIESDTDSKEVIYSGRTWHGILNSKVLQPDSGEAYLTVSGEANSVIASLLTRMGLEDLFEASSEDSKLTVNGYKMNRYISGYDGIMKMLGTVGGKLKMAFSGGKVVLSAVPRVDYTQDEEFDADQVSFRAKRNYKGVNHLICLGSGQLEERMVVHLYADTDGTISQTQTQFGLDEVCAIFEYSNIETEEELTKEGMGQFESLKASDEINIDFDADSDVYDVGDIIGAVDNVTGIFITTKVAKKIVTIKNGEITISLTPETVRSSNGASGGSSGGGVIPTVTQYYVTPQMFGAVGDGVADDTDAVQAALDNGGIIYFPAGRYKVTRQISALMPGKIIMASPYPTSGEADLPRTEDELECGARIECYNNDGIGFLVGDSIQVDGLFIRAKTNFSGILLKYDGSQGQRSYPSTSSFRNILLDSGANSNKLVSFFDFCPSGNYGICVEKVVIGNKYMYQFSDYGFRAEFDEWANSIRLADFVVDVRATHPVYIKNKTGDSGSAKNWVLQNITIQAQKFTADMLVTSHQNCFYMDYVHQSLLLGCKVWDYGWSTFTGDVVTAVGCVDVAAFGCDSLFAALDTVLTAQLDDAANHLNIESLVLTADEYDNKTTVKMTDGTHQKTVDINKVSLSDEQIGSAVGLWMDENMTPHEVLGRNKFNPDDENNRMGYLYAGGGFANSDDYWTTGYIPASYGVVIRCSDDGVAKHLSMVAAYNAGKGFIAREGNVQGREYTVVSENAAFIRICIKTSQIPFENLSTTMITIDDPSYEFEEYGTHMEGGMGQYSILMSPNGTKYSLAVDDDGNLYASPV